MTIIEAFTEFVNSDDFKNVARLNDSLGAKYRIYKRRHEKAELKAGAMVDLLISNCYEITARKTVKKKSAKKK